MTALQSIRSFFVAPFSLRRLREVTNASITKKSLYVTYLCTTVLLAIAVRLIVHAILGREIGFFASNLHFALNIMRNVLVIVVVDFFLMFGTQYVTGARTSRGSGDLSLKIVVFTNFPIILGSLVLGIVSFLPVYFLTVLWKFFMIRRQMNQREGSKRQLNVNTVLLFGYYAIIYYFVSWGIAAALLRVQFLP